MDPDPDRYFLKLAAAFVRGRCIQGDSIALPESLRAKPLEDLSEGELASIFQHGLRAGLKLHKYIRASLLTAVLAAEGHWLNRPIIPNRLREGADLFEAE